MNLIIVAIGVGFILVDESVAFQVVANCQRLSSPSSSQLFAKSNRKGKKKATKTPSNVVGGGFGKKTSAAAVATKEPKQQGSDDYAAFPALEPSVMETLVPSTTEYLEQPAGSLPLEILDRLDQIYGFPHFNSLPEEQEDTSSGLSFDDILSASNEEATTKSEFIDILETPASTAKKGDFADLLDAATGATSSNPNKFPSSSSSSKSEPKVIDTLSLSKIPEFSKLRVLHVDPLVIAVEDFFTSEECDRYLTLSSIPKGKDAPLQSRSMTVGKDALAKAQRTSTTWFHHYKTVPELMAKASRLLGLPGIEQWEEPQIVRYRRNEKFTWHLDALAPAQTEKDSAGQRIVTLLVYLTELEDSDGGATIFRDLGGPDRPLRVRPKKGSALVFFPAAGGIPNTPFDIRTLHCGEAVSETSSQDKWISQLWLRKNRYTPTAPQGNLHTLATADINEYCSQFV